MAFDAVHSEQPMGFQLARPVELTCFALCVAQAVYLAASFVQGSFLVDPQGQAIATDFVNVWAGGRQALDGSATAAYDLALHKAAEVAAVGHAFDGHYPWIYPPTFLFAATLLALLPYVQAQAVWMLLTFPIYAAAIRRIIGDRMGILLACAFPGILSNAMVGQNGFVTAALFGGALLFMERRPILAGCLIGLLSFKPHLGILFPIALIAGGHWRVIAAAATVVVVLFVASSLVFGIGTWEAFLHALPVASQASLTDGRADWAKLQSVFGLIRMIGGSEGLAWTLQAMLMAGIAVALGAIWRSKVSFDVKAGALVTGALLSTPYLFMYDLVVLAVPMAFLLRAGRNNGDAQGDIVGLGAASLLILVFPFVKAPVGLAAILMIAALTGHRALIYFMRVDASIAHAPLPTPISK
jgi:arabinofuranan 3-O-arabinosyltransferase